MKYKEWLYNWLELYEKESVKPRTYKQYEDVINKRLIPALGDYEMEDLSPIILQRYIVDLSQKGNTKTGERTCPQFGELYHLGFALILVDGVCAQTFKGNSR